MAECGSLCEMKANLKLRARVKERLEAPLILHSQVVMETYLQWGYIRDMPTQSVPHFSCIIRAKVAQSTISKNRDTPSQSNFNGKFMIRGAVNINDLVVLIGHLYLIGVWLGEAQRINNIKAHAWERLNYFFNLIIYCTLNIEHN